MTCEIFRVKVKDQRSSTRLTAIRVATDTEQIGEEVGTSLRGQRDQLIRTRDRLQDADVELTRAGRLISAIRYNVISNKMFLIFIIIIECAILIALCYLKFIR
ncbi:vesicle transport through interaction with t-SNAREs homolog 1A-like [Galendromus occidentalis]|uniref:Vesicle transport through interaction with t-SNAREs homolog 1A-like n=1 Tax=Galendromus occidentalis TaxID=34638 RepID=A0AAJ7SEC8_9ACAR|nr:vesicle transport through interaction with t-SNAREs homolog 1A-like [Galendromus occidentalis]